jgi:hypothetical protein
VLLPVVMMRMMMMRRSRVVEEVEMVVRIRNGNECRKW